MIKQTISDSQPVLLLKERENSLIKNELEVKMASALASEKLVQSEA